MSGFSAANCGNRAVGSGVNCDASRRSRIRKPLIVQPKDSVAYLFLVPIIQMLQGLFIGLQRPMAQVCVVLVAFQPPTSSLAAGNLWKCHCRKQYWISGWGETTEHGGAVSVIQDNGLFLGLQFLAIRLFLASGQAQR